ncbi:MAG TPA: choice-of-anchor D domain-containing protein [Acidisarcina sp.]
MQQSAGPAAIPAGGAWIPLGPAQVTTSAYGKVTGRISSIAVDPADPSGNTVYIGSTGGGVWKSTNAAGNPATVVFSPLTDSINGNAVNGAVSISVGAITVQPGGTGVVLAGTGDPNDALDSYWGSGILRSTDGGLTWTRIYRSNESATTQYTSRQFTGLAFAGFAWSNTNPNLVVAAVSESSESIIVNAENAVSQVGVYYSTDAGATWLLATIQDAPGSLVQSPQLPSPTAAAATAVVWNPVRRRFYAAIRFHGYYESLDGITWIRAATQPGASLDTTSCPASYSSVACPLFRGALAVQPVTGDLFAITADINNIDQGLWQDSCAQVSGACTSPTVNFQSLPSQALEDGTGAIPQADYDLWLAAVPVSNDTILYAGTEDIFRCSLAAGCAWRNTTNVNTCAAAQVAPAQHSVDATQAASLNSALPGLMYFGNDGGLWRTTDGVTQTSPPCSAADAAQFQNLNGALGSLSEVAGLATDPTNPAINLAAQGVLGTSAPEPPGQTIWPQVLDGEGSDVAIDPAAPANWFAASGSGVSIHACNQGDNCSIAGFGPVIIGSAQVGGDGDALPYPAAWILDPQDTAQIIVGTCRVWRGPGSGGSGWSAANDISPFLDGAGPGGSNQVCTSNGVIRSLAASGTVSNLPGSQELIYAGMAGVFDGGSTVAGRIYSAAVSTSSGATTPWTDQSTSPVTNDPGNQGLFNPGGFAISSIAVDAHDPTGNTVYAAIEGFSGNGISEPRVYSSTDGGAHWLNITANLPPGPVNSIIVDPNDANSVYLGLDVGVFSTNQIGACANGGACWSSYGTSLPDAPVTKLTIFNPGNAGSRGSASPGQEELQAATYGRGVWQTALASTQTTATLAPGGLTFPSQPLSTPGTPQTLTLTNTGALLLTFSRITATTDYTESDNCLVSLAGGSSCTIQITFNPSVLGARPGTLTVFANVPGGQLTATLNGNGIPGASVVPLPTSLAFGGYAIGAASPSQVVTISNTGGVAVNLSSETSTGDFQIVNNTCGPTLPPNTGCSIAINFTPSASGSRTGALTIVDSVGTQTIPLNGTGLAPPTDVLSPMALTFSAQVIGIAGASQAVTITNNGDITLTSIAATASGDFSVSSGCGNSLAGHTSCLLLVTYLPTRAGPASGLLTISDALHSQTVTLSGTGLPAAVDIVTPLSLVFSPQPLNVPSTPQFVTLLDQSSAVLTLISAGATGDFVLNSGCTPTLQGHASCTFSVSYLPTRTGPEIGSLLITDANGTQTVALSGTGLSSTALAASPSSLAFGAVNLQVASAPQTLTITSAAGTPMTGLAFAITGDYAIATNTCPQTLQANASCALQIVFTPTASGTRPGSVSVTSSALTGPLVVPLTGTGQAPATDVLAPSALDFGSVPLNTASVTRHISLTNSGNVALPGIAARVTGSFILQSGCGPALAPQSSCVFALEFLPTTAGANAGNLIVTDALQTQQVPLTGFGQTAATDALTPPTLSFGNQTLNTSSAPQLVTLSNKGDLSLTGIVVSIAGDFVLGNNLCASTLPGHTTCTMTVIYSPATAGAETGVLTVVDVLRAQTVALTGNAVVAPTDSLSPASLTFFPQALNTTSPPQSVTLTNSAGTTLTGIGASAGGDFALAPSTTCGPSLAAGASCIFDVTFTPTHTGIDTGVLTVTDALHTQTVALNGPVQTPATAGLSPLTLAFGSQMLGIASAAQAVTLSNMGEATLTGIKTTITGDFSVVSACGTVLAGQSSCALNVVYTPSHLGAAVGTLTVTTVLGAQKVGLTGTGTSVAVGSTFSVQANGAITASIASGASAGYAVDVVADPGSSGAVAMTCSGLPAYSTCGFTPSSVTLVPGMTIKVNVLVTTGVGISLGTARPPALPGALRKAELVLLGMVLPARLLRKSRKAGRNCRRGLSTGSLLGLTLLAAALALGMSGCGGATVSSTGTGGGGGNTTPSGTYTITVTGTQPPEAHSVTFTLIVQ